MKARIKKEEAYVTKRIVKTISRTSIKEAFDSSMNAMGYVVIAEKGSLVRVNADGTKQTISEIKHPKRTSSIALD